MFVLFISISWYVRKIRERKRKKEGEKEREKILLLKWKKKEIKKENEITN